jgi:hypothetical protein
LGYPEIGVVVVVVWEAEMVDEIGMCEFDVGVVDEILALG